MTTKTIKPTTLTPDQVRRLDAIDFLLARVDSYLAYLRRARQD